ncbi:SycD/LcrH family type III secretion system chaperone [Yersinia aldovae]|uniref:Secretion system chaperone SscB n=1 Tax=Yersinia aldovae TaxID=29483 RepID=A0A0T9U4G8_YERAL|nr:SycD/LcrH family type III secretion system chaperone [Yersinia aldovae]EEP96370.1 Type III secretion low calcium response chaperone LcrH/SycD [Yersinia aldovae ATCC 35236]CNJ53871.1 secretion system chaperone SscB [Yersinia aldovae]CNL19349.1 secretion system chaperone SscB [Yersinia aldovae]CNL65652.1 secretion system chaperone SscB [Yersinia aldovae]
MKTTSNEHEQHCYQSAVVKEAMALDPETVYAQGYAAWQEGRYDRALIDFGWLVMSQPWSWRAHVALAGALMMQKEYAMAMNYYGYALMLDACHPEPVYQMGVCLNALGERSLAREALQTALTMSYDDPLYSSVRANVELMLSQLLA